MTSYTEGKRQDNNELIDLAPYQLGHFCIIQIRVQATLWSRSPSVLLRIRIWRWLAEIVQRCLSERKSLAPNERAGNNPTLRFGIRVCVGPTEHVQGAKKGNMDSRRRWDPRDLHSLQLCCCHFDVRGAVGVPSTYYIIFRSNSNSFSHVYSFIQANFQSCNHTAVTWPQSNLP